MVLKPVMTVSFYRCDESGFTIYIRLTPKSAKDIIAGVEETADGKRHLSVKIRAVPEDGKANKALIKFLAKQWKIPSSSLILVSGSTSRIKTLHYEGDVEILRKKLESIS